MSEQNQYSDSQKRRGACTIAVAALLVAALALFLVTFQVRVNESAIVFTFGKAPASPLLCEEDIRDAEALVLKLRDTNNPAAAHVLKQLPAETQRALGEYAPPAGVPDPLAAELIDGLNRMLQSDALADAALFEDQPLPEILRTRIAGHAEGMERLRLNRDLLAHVFSDEISIIPHAGAITKPGLYLKWPYPIQTVKKFDTPVNVFKTKFQEAYTADSKNLVVTLAIGWSIDNPIRYNERVASADKAASHIAGSVMGMANTIIGQHTFGEFVSVDEQKLAFDRIEQEIVDAVRPTVEANYGVRLEFVRFSELSLPDKVLQSVYSRMETERSRIAQKYRAEGKSEADRIKAAADQQRADIISEAEAAATRLRGEGDAAAAEYYGVFSENPDLAIFLRQLDSLRKLKERSTIVIDTTTPPYNLLRGDVPIPVAPAVKPGANDAVTAGGGEDSEE